MQASFRGAVSAENNKVSITENVCTLWDQIISSNNIRNDEISCIILSQTKDINAINCASALRKGRGISGIPLFCVQEAYTKDGMPLVIRMLIISDRTIKSRSEVHHVYIGRASQLRPDLSISGEASNTP